MSWQLTAADLPDLARGATLLGTGGGGDPYIGKMLVERVLGKGSITILDPDELADDLFVIPTAQMGAPTVMIEKIPAGTEPTLALRTLEEHLGRTADATMPIECGGINSMIPLIVAAETGLPVVDADGMGRAFPELSMETFAVYGVHGSPARARRGTRGEGRDRHRRRRPADGVARPRYHHPPRWRRSHRGVRDDRSRRPANGRAPHDFDGTRARPRHPGRPRGAPFAVSRRSPTPLSTTLYPHLRELCVGKVIDVERRTTEGFAKGRAVIAPLGAEEGDTFEISFQNENPHRHDRGETLVAIVPDLICVVEPRDRRADHDRGAPVRTSACGCWESPLPR